MIPIILACVFLYLFIGAAIALYSGTYFWFFTLLWPWPIAAEIVKQFTGKYPKWTPQL